MKRRSTISHVSLVPLLLFVVLAHGCTIFVPGHGYARIVPSLTEELEVVPFSVGEVSVDGFFEPEPIEADARYILLLFVELANQAETTVSDREPLILDVAITERRVVDDYVARNSISVEITASDPAAGEEAVIRSYYSVDADKSVESYDFLQTVLSRSLRQFLPRSRRP